MFLQVALFELKLQAALGALATGALSAASSLTAFRTQEPCSTADSWRVSAAEGPDLSQMREDSALLPL